MMFDWKKKKEVKKIKEEIYMNIILLKWNK